MPTNPLGKHEGEQVLACETKVTGTLTSTTTIASVGDRLLVVAELEVTSVAFKHDDKLGGLRRIQTGKATVVAEPGAGSEQESMVNDIVIAACASLAEERADAEQIDGQEKLPTDPEE